MAIVVVPALMRDLTGGAAHVRVSGATIGQVIANLDALFPGFRARLCEGDDISPHIGVFVNGDVCELRMLQPVGEESEIQFLPAMQGG